MRRRSLQARVLSGIGLAGLLTLLPGVVYAHLGSTKYLRVGRTDSGVAVVVDVEAIDARLALGARGVLPALDPAATSMDEGGDASLLAHGDDVGAWLTEGITITAGDTRCAPSWEPPARVTRDGRRYLTVHIDYACPERGAWVLDDRTVFPDDRQHEAIVQIDGKDARVLRRGRQSLALPSLGERPDPGPWGLVAAFSWEGVLHFATGYDHVLFLLSLVLAAGFVVRRRGLRAALRDVAVVVTAFTVGHSVTLIAAALRWVVLPSRPVEIVIAASIAAVALHNVVRPEARGPLPWLAAAFGLIHGFGFSSVLSELGLPAHRTVVALLAFNVGIEVAQLAFVAAVMGPIAWAARHAAYRTWVVRGGSAVIALLALYWVAERVIG